MAHETRRHASIKKAQATKLTYPTTKYTMNNSTWFQHVFGNEADDKITQASSAPYNGKTFSGRPDHYQSGKPVPTNLRGFTQLYNVNGGYDHDAATGAGHIDFASVYMDTLRSSKTDNAEAPSRYRVNEATSGVAKKTKKRALPEEFTKEGDSQRASTRTRTEENWEFGRALAKRQVHSLRRDAKALKKWREVGQHKIAEEPQEVSLGTLGGGEQLYEKSGNKGSFLFLQVDVVMPLSGDADEMTPSP